MNRIEEMKQALIKFRDDLDSGRLMKSVIEELEAYIIDTNVEDQLYDRGIDSINIKLEDYEPYAPMTIQIKQSKGQPTDRVTLRDEGDFHSSFQLKITDQDFTIEATDPKTPKLVKKYGKEIFGLTPENTAKLIWEDIYPIILQKLKRAVNESNS